MKCERCGARGVTSISITLKDGTEVEFSFCGDCETKTWRAEETVISLRDVLELATPESR